MLGVKRKSFNEPQSHVLFFDYTRVIIKTAMLLKFCIIIESNHWLAPDVMGCHVGLLNNRGKVFWEFGSMSRRECALWDKNKL